MQFPLIPYIVIERWFTNNLLPRILIKPLAIINVKSRSISALKLMKLNITNVTQDQKLQETALHHDASISK